MAGSIEKRGNTSYRLTISAGFDGNGKRIKHTKTVNCASEREAEKELARFVVAVENQQHTTSGKMTLTGLYEYWKEHHASKNLAPTTIACYNFIYPRIKVALGHKRIDKIEPRHIQAFLSNLAEPGIKRVQQKKDSNKVQPKESLSASSIKKHHELLSSMFNKAVRWGLLPYNPCQRIDPPKLERKSKDIYDQQALGLFLHHLEGEDDKYKLWTLLALTGGLRREEIFGLEWKHINFETATLRIEQASVYTPETGTILKGTKNKSSTRSISIPQSVVKLLKQHQLTQNEERLNIGDKWQESGRIFTQWDGKPGHPHSFNTWLRRFCINKKLPSISPHDFRHMAATYLITSGTDIRTVSGKLGHSRSSVTLDIYSHLVASAEQETANTMETFLQTAMKQQKNSEKKEPDHLPDSL